MIKQLVIKYPISLFCIINFLTVIFIVVFFSFNNIPQWAPGLYAILIVIVLKGKVGMYLILKSTLFKTVYFKFYLLALILPIFICGLSYIVISFIESKELIFLTFEHSFEDYGILVLFIVLGSYGEEIGWRGFMLPQLQKKYSLVKSSIIIGAFWGIWHLNILSGIPVFTIYILLVIEFSLITSWLYVKTNGNIMAPIILHASIDICSFVFFEKTVTAEIVSSQSMMLLYGTITICFFFPCIFMTKDMLSNKQDVYKSFKK